MWLSRAVLAASVVAAVVAAPVSGSASDTAARLVGQSIMTGIDGRTPGSALLARIRAGQVGGVILFARNVRTTGELTRLIASLQAAAAEGGNPPLLIAVDQEGGAVKRLPHGPPDRSAAAMGRDGSAALADAQAFATAAYLKRLGIDLDLAPVLDTPASPASFLGSRAFSADPKLNAALGTAFVEGLQRGGVAATAKHFPGLGTARLSTDANHVLLTTAAPALERRLVPFARAIDAGVKVVMVSNAGYSVYDPTAVPAVVSRPIVTGLLRERLGFRGVVISDAMEAPGPSGRPHAAVSAITAGVDVLLYAREGSSAAGYTDAVAAARSGALPLRVLRRAAARVAALKRWVAHH
jgi:beta-N-acetylhexosaminidase